MAIERRFSSYTKDGDQEYSVDVFRVDDKFSCKVVGKFGDHPTIERSFEADGPDAEQKVQEFLFNLDEEVRSLLEPKQDASIPDHPVADEPQAPTLN